MATATERASASTTAPQTRAVAREGALRTEARMLTGEEDIVFGGVLESREIGRGDGTTHHRGNAGHEGSRRNHGALEQHAARRDQRLLADLAIVEHDRPHADQASV